MTAARAPLLMALASLAIAAVFAAPRQPTKIDAYDHMRRLCRLLMIEASRRQETFPDSLQDLRDEIAKVDGLAAFVAHPNFRYLAPNLKLADADAESLLCSFDYPSDGQVLLYCYGNIEWRETPPSAP